MASGSQLRVYLAGRVAVESNGHVIDETRFPGRQGRLLFAYLVAEQGRSVPRDELAEALWGETPPATWEKALTVIASKLRAVLADSGLDAAAALTGAHGCYRLVLPDETWVDVVAAVTAARRAEEALSAGDTTTARAEATAAASLAEKPFLPGDEGDWVTARRRDLGDVRVRALSVLADVCLRSGDPAAAATLAEQVVALEPFRETGYRRLMEAHAAAGNRAEALRVYERCRRLLADELGAYPSPETDAIYRSLLERPPVPGVPADETATAGHPPHRHRGRRAVLVAAVPLVVAAAIAAGFVLADRGGSAPTVVPNSVVRIDADTLKVKQVVRVGDAPDLVIASGGYVWVTNHVLRDVNSGALRNAGDRTLTRVDPSTGAKLVVGGGLAPCGLTADPSGDVWVADCYVDGGRGDDVVRLDARTLVFKRMHRVPGGDGFFRGLAYGGGSLWVSQIVGGDHPNADAVTEVDPQTGRSRTMPLAHQASGLVWAGGYGDLWINHFRAGSVTRLHAASGAVDTIGGLGLQPAFPVVAGNRVWFAHWSSPAVVSVPAVGQARAETVKLPLPAQIGVWAVAAGAGAIWATTPHAGALWRIDPKTHALTRIPLPFLPSGVTTDGNDVWVTVRKR